MIHLIIKLVITHVILSSNLAFGEPTNKVYTNKACQQEFNQNLTFTTFDPFVSDEDVWIESSYEEMDLIPLLEIVYRRFDKMVVQLRDKPPDSSIFDNEPVRNTSATRARIPVAAAIYNKKLNASSSSQSPIQIWLNEDMRIYVADLHGTSEFRTRIHSIIQLANKANQIFPETVPAIILDFSMVNIEALDSPILARQVRVAREEIGKTEEYFQYKLVVGVPAVNEVDKFQNLAIRALPDLFERAEPDIGVITIFPQGNTFSVTTASKIVDTFVGKFLDLRDVIRKEKNLTFPLILQTAWPDTDLSGNTSYHNLVHFWKGISSWAKVRETSVIFDGAFDLPYREESLYQTTGWWRLIPNGSYESASDFKFVEKCHLISGENCIVTNSRKNFSLTHLHEDVSFSRKHFGVRFNRLEMTRRTSLPKLLNLVTRRYFKLVINAVYGRYPVSKMCSLTRAVANTNREAAQRKADPVELIISIGGSPIFEDWGASLNNSKVCADEANLIYNDTVTTIVLQGDFLTVSDLKDWASDIYDSVVEFGALKGKLKFGTFLDVTFCSGAINGSNFEREVTPLVHPPWNLNTIGFRYVVSKDMVRLGSLRILPRVAALFQSCQRKFAMVAPQTNLLFITTWPDKDNNQVENYAELVNYWEGMNLWAQKSNTTVILESAFDDYYERDTLGRGWTGGWWKLIPNQSYKSDTDFKFEDKKTLARRILEKEIADKGSDSTISAIRIQVLSALGSAGLAILLCVAVVASIVCYSRRSIKLRQLIFKFFEGDQDSDNPYEMKPYHKQEWEIAKGDFFIDKNRFLGSGEFGMVYGGWVVVDQAEDGIESTQIAVAVKMCKSCGAALEALLSEIKIMAYLGNHENIVSLIGAHTAEIEKGKVLAFVEFCELGSLQDYLRNESQASPYSPSSLSRWSLEIASGMEYLSQMKVVHIDLATRNVLLNAKKTAKISDFGLSRKLYSSLMYKKKTDQRLPWRWLAPESLRKMQFSEKTDVWAFGVTLWEIYSLGDIPFPRDIWNDEFIQRLENGERLAQPGRCDDCIFTIMMECWERDSELRPTFTIIKSELEKTFGEYSTHI